MKYLHRILLLSSVFYICAGRVCAAPFDSGSDGSDGDLFIAPNLGQVVFDPDSPLMPNPLDVDRDGIYHFTSIIIGGGTSVEFRSDVLGHKPVIWLASGHITIDGDLILSADPDGTAGAGGFPGGQPNGAGNSIDGQGPGGGVNGQPASEAHINSFLLPLIGGSGAGAHIGKPSPAPGGGGAMLLASSETIHMNGSIDGFGAEPFSGNFRLMSNELLGTGNFVGFNVVRLEVSADNFTGNIDANEVVRTRPSKVFRTNPIKITLVDNLLVDQTRPGANKGEPDVVIDTGNEVTIRVECSGIPLGTIIEVVGWNEVVGKVFATTGPLNGTLEASEATCQMVIPTGSTTFMARASGF